VDLKAAVNATEAYFKAYDLAQSADSKTAKKVSKSVLEGLRACEDLLNNYGVDLYQSNDYAGALVNFNLELKIYDLLKENGEASRLEGEGLYNDKIYFTGITATYAEDYDKAIPLLEKVMNDGTEEAVVYQFLYQGHDAKGNDDKASMILSKGRELFPDDTNLLFTEINHYLKKGELEKMIENLKSALDKEPGNVSVITTLGQVYDQLSVSSDKDGNAEKSEEYFNEAASYYSSALNTKSDNFDLNYSMGALYYNRAATFTDDLNALADDFTPAGVKKYEAIKAKMAGFFDKALPYFLKADSINSLDRNTLIALKEISARKDDFAGSEEYKKRLEALEN
jgi:tetratricopeptide (TPR) repeat protein